MRSAAPLLAIVVVIAGCGDSSERAYYQTRYIPSDIETSYHSIQHEQWHGDPTVYELPSGPPALEDEHYARRDCAQPGPHFKPQAMVGTHDEVRGSSDPSLQAMGGWDERPTALGPVGPDHPQKPGSMGEAPPAGLHQTSQRIPVGGWDPRPLPHQGPNEIEAITPGRLGEQPKGDYCLPPETPTVPSR